MVAHNPLFQGKWTAKKFKATVITDIWPEVLFFTLVATMVYLVSTYTSHNLGISTQLLTVLGTVLGLVISFRTSSAYERYQDGRKLWTSITIASRNIAQYIWIHVPSERPNGSQTLLQNVIEKKTMVHLVQGFSVAVKHLLRGESGVYYRDLYPLICFLPRYVSHHHQLGNRIDMLPLWHASEDDHHHEHPHHNVREAAASDVHARKTASLPTLPHGNDLVPDTEEKSSEISWYRSWNRRNGPPPRHDAFDPEEALPFVDVDRPLKPARNPPKTTMDDYLPVLRLFRWIGRKLFHRKSKVMRKTTVGRNALGKKKAPESVDSNVPLEICLYLSSYSAYLMKNGLLQPAVATALTNNIAALQDTLTNLERIRNTPLPFAYQAHLRMSLWLYLFFLPFQIYDAFSYLIIPSTAFASFLLLGFLEIGQEIENPFNYDANDLDLDHFCLCIQRELHEITVHTSPNPDAYVFSAWNQPFAPADRRTAAELTRDGAQEYRSFGRDANGGVEPGMMSIRKTLLQSWREVDKITRDTT